MKAAITLITLTIIVAVVVSISLMVWLYLSGFFSEISYAGEVRTEKGLEVLSSCIKIEEAFQNKFFIRNCGNGVITNDTLNIYVDDELIDFELNPVSIEGGKTGAIILNEAWGMSIEQHSLRIINPNTEALTNFKAELPDSAVLALDFDEGSGTTAYDKSRYGNDGTISGATVVEGKFGKALKFDGPGSGDNVNVPDMSVYNFNTNDSFTIEMWAKTDIYDTSDTIYMIFAKYPSGAPAIRIATRKGCFPSISHYNSLRDSSNIYTYFGGTCPQVGVWFHLAVVRDVTADQVLFYVNGILQDSPTDETCPTCHYIIPASIVIGSTWNGTIDSVRIYNKALTPDKTLKFRII